MKPVEHVGKESRAFTRRMAEGKHVRVDYDQANARVHRKDCYGARANGRRSYRIDS
jgi:hypothetical protein